MENNLFIEKLMNFGLTRQEASIYQCLLTEGKTTGYEVAKQIGISRSNAYNSLASMTEKGAAYLVTEGTTKKYVPVPLEEFCKNNIRKMDESRRWLIKNAPAGKVQEEGYITIEGRRNILDKMKNLFTGYLERGINPADGTRNNMGIGLSVCAAIIKAHDSEISARNLNEGGAEFKFSLLLEEKN